MRGPGRTFRAIAVFTVIVPRCAAAQDDPPPSNAEVEHPAAPRYLSLTRFDAYLELKGQYSDRQVDAARAPYLPNRLRQVNREWEVQERLGLTLAGSAFDPNVLTFGGDLSFALVQSEYTEHGDFFDLTDRDNGNLLLYDLRLNVLPGKKVSGSVYGLRQEDRINRRFQPTLDQTRSGLGTNWVFSDARLPMELSYDYLETDRTGNVDRRDDEHFTESNLRYRADWIMSPRQKLTLGYEHGVNQQEFQGLSEPFETTRDLLTAEHSLDFGPGGGHNLRTILNWQEESGDFARDFFRVGPQLTLKHSEALQSLYKYQFNRERYAGLDVESQRADFQLTHRPYANLTTTFDAFGLHEDVERDARTTQSGASVDWQYHRDNRFGRMSADLALGYDLHDMEGDEGRRIILDESHTFRDPYDVALRERNVLPFSIVVTDSSDRRIFRKGLDYWIVPFGNLTRLIRVPNGRIADGGTVLVDYQIATPMHGELDTTRVDVSLEQRFDNGLIPYYRLAFRNQEDDASTGFYGRADRTDHHRLGVKYERPRYTLGVEYEIFDDSVEPYDSFHVDGTLRFVERLDHSLDATTRFSRMFFEGGFDDRDVTFVDVDLQHRWRLSESVSAVQRAGFRFEDDSRDGITHGWDVSAGLEYVAGNLQGELTFEYDRLRLATSEDETIGLFLRLRREFPDVVSR